MKRSLLSFLFLFIGAFLWPGFSTEIVAQITKGKVYTVVEQEPEFPGGTVALSRYLAENIRVPGALVRKNYNAGPIAAKFIIDELGYVHDPRIVAQPIEGKMRKGMEAFMANIIVAVEKMPRWTPGRVAGKPVPVFYTLPVEVNMQ